MGAGVALIVGGFAIKLATSMGPQALPFIGALHPWQLTFLLVGVSGMVILIPLFFVREPLRRGLIATSPQTKGQSVPLRDLWAFIKQNRVTYAIYYTAFPITGLIGIGTITWMPSYFIRVYGWSGHTTGLLYGIVVGVIGTAAMVTGGFLVDWLVSRGMKDAYIRLPLYTMPVNLIIQTSVPFMPNAELAFAASALSMFVFTLPFIGSATLLQLITPNQMRGQLVSYGVPISTFASVALGPLIAALITDYLFKDPMDVGYSLSTMVAILTPICWLLVFVGQKAFNQSLERANAWANATETNGA
jgi:MFS family permease